MITAARLARGSVVVALTFGDAGTVFQVRHPAFWTAGLGDWMDPYFINWRVRQPHNPEFVDGFATGSRGIILSEVSARWI